MTTFNTIPGLISNKVKTWNWHAIFGLTFTLIVGLAFWYWFLSFIGLVK